MNEPIKTSSYPCTNCWPDRSIVIEGEGEGDTVAPQEINKLYSHYIMHALNIKTTLKKHGFKI